MCGSELLWFPLWGPFLGWVSRPGCRAVTVGAPCLWWCPCWRFPTLVGLVWVWLVPVLLQRLSLSEAFCPGFVLYPSSSGCGSVLGCGPVVCAAEVHVPHSYSSSCGVVVVLPPTVFLGGCGVLQASVVLRAAHHLRRRIHRRLWAASVGLILAAIVIVGGFFRFWVLALRA